MGKARQDLERAMVKPIYSDKSIRSYGWQFRNFSEFTQRVPRKLNREEVSAYFKTLQEEKKSRSFFLQTSGMLGILYRELFPDPRIDALLSRLQERYLPERKSS